MHPPHELGSTQTVAFTIIRITSHVKNEYKRFARKVYWVSSAARPGSSTRQGAKQFAKEFAMYNAACFGRQTGNCDARETRDTHFRQRPDTGDHGTRA